MKKLFLAILITPVAFAQDAVPAVTEVASKVDWMQILANPAVVVLLCTIACMILKYFHDAKGLDNDRWVGLVFNLYNAAEKAGVLAKWSGNEKLKYAMDEFSVEYEKTFGHKPGAQDLQDFKNDLAKIAADKK